MILKILGLVLSPVMHHLPVRSIIAINKRYAQTPVL